MSKIPIFNKHLKNYTSNTQVWKRNVTLPNKSAFYSYYGEILYMDVVSGAVLVDSLNMYYYGIALKTEIRHIELSIILFLVFGHSCG